MMAGSCSSHMSPSLGWRGGFSQGLHSPAVQRAHLELTGHIWSSEPGWRHLSLWAAVPDWGELVESCQGIIGKNSIIFCVFQRKVFLPMVGGLELDCSFKVPSSPNHDSMTLGFYESMTLMSLSLLCRTIPEVLQLWAWLPH